jgi:hypothetical protein
MVRYLPFFLVVSMCVYAFIDCLHTPQERVRGLPKPVWAIIILLFGVVLLGPMAWLLLGKHRYAFPRGRSTHSVRNREQHWVPPDDNPEFLRSLEIRQKKDDAHLRDWEADLRRREEELRRRGDERGSAESEDTPPTV